MPERAVPLAFTQTVAISALAMVGTITKPSNPLEALIEDPTGSVTRVRVGSYMGRNFGRVVEVSSDQIALVEIVPDGQDGWVERSRNISLAE